MTFRSLRPQSVHGRQAEARRNDLMVLEAARDVFTAQGADAPVSAVAERAGVRQQDRTPATPLRAGDGPGPGRGR